MKPKLIRLYEATFPWDKFPPAGGDASGIGMGSKKRDVSKIAEPAKVKDLGGTHPSSSVKKKTFRQLAKPLQDAFIELGDELSLDHGVTFDDADLWNTDVYEWLGGGFSMVIEDDDGDEQSFYLHPELEPPTEWHWGEEFDDYDWEFIGDKFTVRPG